MLAHVKLTLYVRFVQNLCCMSNSTGGGIPHGPMPALAQITSTGPWTASHSAMACCICRLPQAALSIRATGYQILFYTTERPMPEFASKDTKMAGSVCVPDHIGIHQP